MEDQAVTIPEIRALVAERQRFDDWLTALEARRADTPARVFERVHADYLARRDAVIDNLHTHVGSLELLERDLDNRLQELEAQLAEREDARAEGMLRTAVGEFDSEKWETTRVEVEEAITQLGADREALLTETEDVRALLGSARHKPHVPEADVEAEPLVVAGVPDLEPELVSANVAQAIAHTDPGLAEHGVDLDSEGEISSAPAADAGSHYATDPYQSAARRHAEVESDIESAFAVQDDAYPRVSNSRDVPAHPYSTATPRDSADAIDATHTDAAHAASAHAAAEAADRELHEAVDAIDAMPSATVPHSIDDIDVFGDPSATRRGAQSEVAHPRASDATYASDAPAGGASTGGMPKRDDFDDLAFLRSITESGSAATSGAPRASSSTEQTKSLRCTECGTMNFPTEWYCERCGGELATF